MALIQSTSNAFELVDRTNDLILLPQNPTLMSDSGIWREEYLTTNTVTFEEQNGSLSIIKDQIRGAKPQTLTGDVRKLHSYVTTHHPVLDALYPQDIAGVTRPGSNATALDIKDAAMLRKMEKIRKSYDRTLNLARFRTLATGQVFAPNGTVSGSFYSDFGITRKTVNFALATPTTDVMGKSEEIIASFNAAATGGQEITRVIAYASPGFFTALINHPKVQQAYNLYSATAPQQISRDRAGGLGMYRRFVFNNIEYIEVSQFVDGQPLVPANEAIFVAQDGDDSFITFFTPAARFGLINTVAEAVYLWSFEDIRGTEITLEGESNFINIIRKPAFVAAGTVA